MIALSPFHDPYTNLALEDYFLQSLPMGERMVFLYVNNPSVVLGRFQNPWLECRPEQLGGINLVRRQSGGGTVYHDGGNLNFSFIQHGGDLDKRSNLQEVVDLLTPLGINLQINHREDLVLVHKGETKKVSGSAYRHRGERAFHHGTLLISSNRDNLRSALSPDSSLPIRDARGTPSHRSPVINLNQIIKGVEVKGVIVAFCSYYSLEKGFNLIPQDDLFWKDTERREDVQNEREALQKQEWIYGKTPAFMLELSSFSPTGEKRRINVTKGRITDPPKGLEYLGGRPFHPGLINC